MKKPKLVAHRGFAAEYPENSLAAFNGAISCGCLYLELDVQITKDQQAVVIHDVDLTRTGNSDIHVLSSNWAEIENEPIGEASRFGNKFEQEKLILLDDFVTLLQNKPKVHAFVEIKEESIDLFGAKKVLDIICKTIHSVKNQCSLISFDATVLFEAKTHTDYALGFVLHKYDKAHRDVAIKLSPDILICNYKKIPDQANSLWQGPWDWFLYEIVEPELAMKWFQRGVKYIETMQICSMIKMLEK